MSLHGFRIKMTLPFFFVRLDGNGDIVKIVIAACVLYFYEALKARKKKSQFSFVYY